MRPNGPSSDWRKDVDCAFSAPEGFSLAPASLAAARACSTRVTDAADRGFDRGRAERCELAQDRQIPPTRCRAAGPALHPLASEPDYERGVMLVSALCISVQQSTPRQWRQMQEVRKTPILRPVSSGSMHCR